MKAALQATYFQKSLDWEKLTFPDQISRQHGFVFNSAELRPGELSKKNVDFSAGILGYSEKFFAGVAVHHLPNPTKASSARAVFPAA